MDIQYNNDVSIAGVSVLYTSVDAKVAKHMVNGTLLY